MSNVSVEYLVLRDNVEFSRLTAFKGGGAAISVTVDAAVKWALSGKFAQNSAVNYLTDVIQPVLTIDGVRQPLGKYIPTDAYTEHDGMRPVVSLTAYDLTYLAMSSKIETRLHLAKGTLYTAAIQALLVESGVTDIASADGMRNALQCTVPPPSIQMQTAPAPSRSEMPRRLPIPSGASHTLLVHT